MKMIDPWRASLEAHEPPPPPPPPPPGPPAHHHGPPPHQVIEQLVREVIRGEEHISDQIAALQAAVDSIKDAGAAGK